MKYSTPRGTRDILPPESQNLRWIIDEIVTVFKCYDFKEIHTPIFESVELFQRAVGDSTDIVSKEMYVFEDKGGRQLTLRPEGTASVVRAYLQHQQVFNKEKVTKLFYCGPMFRYERPQNGRYRQFHQIGVEALGSQSPLLDVEIMAMGIKALQKLGIRDVNIAINSVGCDVCRPVIREQLKEFVGSILPNLCEDCIVRFDSNPLRILDCKNPQCQTYFAGLPEMSKALCKECNDHFISVLNHLEESSIPYKVDGNLVRGLDYYTKTVYEIQSPLLGAQNAICGGGRYDNLINELGGRKTPAFGFALGLDRLLLVLEQIGVQPDLQANVEFYIMGLDQESRDRAFVLVQKLREEGRRCAYSFHNKSVADGLKDALQKKAGYAIILGEEEVSEGFFTIKNLREKKQFTVKTVDEILAIK